MIRADPVDIELADGSTVQDLRSVRRWKDTRTGPLEHLRDDADPVTMDELLGEAHHAYYGRPWILGRFYFEHLLSRTLRPDDRVLDLGCGAGRVGIWLLDYLSRARYFGVDSHLRSLVAFAHYETVLHGLTDKQPRLLLDPDFAVEHFATSFDVVLDFFVTRHLKDDAATRAFERVRATMAPGARLFMSHAPPLGTDAMRTLGFDLAEAHEVAYPMFAQSSESIVDSDHWHEFRAA